MKASTKKKKPGRRVKAVNPSGHSTRIEFSDPSAERVCIAGSFNDWHPSATDMVPLGKGRWAKELTLPAGSYEYRLVVDDQWIADPHASESVPNPYGGTNSVLHVSAG